MQQIQVHNSTIDTTKLPHTQKGQKWTQIHIKSVLASNNYINIGRGDKQYTGPNG